MTSYTTCLATTKSHHPFAAIAIASLPSDMSNRDMASPRLVAVHKALCAHAPAPTAGKGRTHTLAVPPGGRADQSLQPAPLSRAREHVQQKSA